MTFGTVETVPFRFLPPHVQLLDADGEFLDDGVGEDLAGDAIDFCLGGFAGEPVVEGEEEIFALADVGDAFVALAGERGLHGLALGIEDGAL